jgi:hypothetical protein
MDTQNFFRALVRVRHGVSSTLAEVPGDYPLEEDFRLQVSIRGGEIRAFINASMLFGGPVLDSDPTPNGTVGLYTWANHAATFDDILVHARCPYTSSYELEKERIIAATNSVEVSEPPIGAAVIRPSSSEFPTDQVDAYLMFAVRENGCAVWERKTVLNMHIPIPYPMH